MSDLISRQDVIEKINERAREMFSLAPGYEHYLSALHDIEYDLEQMPTIDAVPVMHGAWVIDGEFIDCSVCKREKWSRVPYEDLVKRFKFCPNCGAKMDGGKDDVVD